MKTFVIILILGLGFSCKSVKISESTTIDNCGLEVDKGWRKFLVKSQVIVKKTVNDYQQSLTEALGDDAPSYWNIDANKLKSIPIDVYNIDSDDFLLINEQTDFKSILKLDKSLAKYYFLEDGEFVSDHILNYKNGTWEKMKGYSCSINFNKTFAEKLKDILFKKHLRYMSIVLHIPGSIRFFNAFVDESGMLMIINISGQIWTIAYIMVGIKKGYDEYMKNLPSN